MLSQGQSIEIFKGVGDPEHRGPPRSCRRAADRTPSATRAWRPNSAVTIAGSHPFSTGEDTCLVHNGSLSNHNRLREALIRHGERFQTDNDSEVAAAYLTWRTRQGDNLKQALNRSLRDLDGFYTFVVGTRDGFAVLRDPVACKPAVMAETDDWVAFGTEFRALAVAAGRGRGAHLGAAAGNGLRLEPEPPGMARKTVAAKPTARMRRRAGAQFHARPRAHDGARGQPAAARCRRRRFPHREPARGSRHRRRARRPSSTS